MFDGKHLFDKTDAVVYNIVVSTETERAELRQVAKSTKIVAPARNHPELVKFVKIWQSSQSVTVVCQKMGIKHDAATQLAVRMRKQGIALKPFQRKGWNNRLLRELGRYAKTAGQPDHFVVGPMRRRIAYLETQVEKLEQIARGRDGLLNRKMACPDCGPVFMKGAAAFKKEVAKELEKGRVRIP